MEQLRQQEPINMTAALEALSPWLNNPRRTVIQAEAFTAGVTMLLLLQLILGSYRRQSSSFLVQSGTWVAYTLSSPLIGYTMGLMQSSPVKNVMYPIWAVSLQLAAECTNAVKVYELDDNKQWKRSLFDLAQYSIYSTLIGWLLFPYSMSIKGYFHYFKATMSIRPSAYFAIIKSPAMVITFLSASVMLTGKVLACILVEQGYFDRRVAKFVKDQAAATNDDGFDPVSMKGYKYPVRFLSQKKDYLLPFHARAHQVSGSDDPVITIDQIWQCEGRLLSSGTHCTGLKDVCLAFALYELLKRRYYGMACAEEHRRETHDLVFKGLLRTEDDYERAFRIVEVELGFCHDYFFTKYPIMFKAEAKFFCLFLLRVILIVIIGVDVLTNSMSVKIPSAIIEVHTKTADSSITLLILGTILLIEILQATFYIASDWFKVSVICKYVTKSRYESIAYIEKIISYLIRFTIFRYWKNRIDQYSIISHSTVDTGDGSESVSMLNMVKRAIARYLRSCDGRLTNGEESLMQNGVLGEFSWAVQGQSQAEIMLIWNIATEYCNIGPTSGDGEHMNGTSTNEQETKFHKQVSVNLSRYCAYLMDSAPELLPGHFGDTTFAMRDVEEEVFKVARFQDVRKKHQPMKGFEEQEEDNTIFARGLKLGKQLERMPDSALRWKVIADFWAEKILYIAPSENVKGHMERLAKGGEFLTHIWVLLTHAGILKINREQDQSTRPSQPPQANV